MRSNRFSVSWSRSVVCRAALTGVFIACGASSAFAQGAPKAAAAQPAPPKPAATATAPKPAPTATAPKPPAPPTTAKPADKPAAGPTAGAPAPKPAKPKPKPRTEKEKKEAAKLAFGAANEKIALGDYAGAYLLYKEADEYVPGAVPKFKMAESLDKAGDVEGAIKAYESFLASKPPPEKNQERIDVANARIAALKIAPADVKVVVQPPEALGATIMVDGKPQAGNPVKVPPGIHTIAVKSEGFEDGTANVEVMRGEKKEITVTLVPKPAGDKVADVGTGGPTDKPVTPVTPPEEEDSGGSIVPAVVTLSLAGAGAVVGTVFGILALGSQSDFEATPTQDLFDETERNALIADMSFGVALTFGVTGLVLLLTSGGDEEEAPEGAAPAAASLKPTFSFTPYAGPQGGGAVGVIKF